jgi:ribonuclease H2 subunit A
MLRAAHAGSYNLNAQAFDATVSLIAGVISSGVCVSEIYVDTVGAVSKHQAKLQKLFPSAAVTVSKKADSIFPIVSAASVCAKVTRDAAIEVLVPEGDEMGSGYPGDEKTKSWLKREMDPVFGWNAEMTRFSWSTTKDMLEGGKETKASGVAVDWPEDLDDGDQLITGFWGADGGSAITGWYGRSVHNEF